MKYYYASNEQASFVQPLETVTSSPELAFLNLTNILEAPLKLYPYIVTNNRIVYYELFENALEISLLHHQNYLYEFETEDALVPTENNPGTFVVTKTYPLENETLINDAYEKFLEEERKQKIYFIPYDQMTPVQKERWDNMVLFEMLIKNEYHSKVVETYFPEVALKYQLLQQSLETEHLILRHARVYDYHQLLALKQSEFVLKYNCMPKADEQSALEDIRNDMMNVYTWYIELKETNEVIGCLNLHNDSLRYGANTKELAYFLSEKESNRGYMSEAISKLIEYVVDTMHLDGLTARTFAPNIASQKVLLKCGFKQEGYLKNCVLGYGNILYDDLLFYLKL